MITLRQTFEIVWNLSSGKEPINILYSYHFIYLSTVYNDYNLLIFG